MKIPFNKLIIHYPDIGNNNAQGNNPEQIGICQLVQIQNLTNMLFIDLAEKIKPFLNIESNNPSLIAIKKYFKLGVEGIYTYNANDGKNIVLVKFQNKFIVQDGNHRVLALILLGENSLEIGRGNSKIINL